MFDVWNTLDREQLIAALAFCGLCAGAIAEFLAKPKAVRAETQRCKR